MKIIYSKINGVIGTTGEYTENETHYIQTDTYYDKASFNVLEVEELPKNFNINDFIIFNGNIINKNEL